MEAGDLQDRLRRNAAYFSAMVELIPASHYVVRDEDDEEEEEGQGKKANRFWHNVKGSKNPALKVKKRRLNASGEEGSEGGGGGEGRGDGQVSKRPTTVSVEHVRSSSLGELQNKLQRRLQELQSCRKMEKEGEVRKKVKKEKESKKDRDSRRRRKGNIHKKEQAMQRATVEGLIQVVGDGGGGGGGVKDECGELSFSRFEFNGSSKPSSGGKDYKKLVSQAEANQRKLEELKAQNEQKAEILEQKQKWSKAVDMAGGKKVRDDPKLLKKTLKRLDKRKKMSKKKWEERVGEEEGKRRSTQERRRQNVQERVKKIKEKKERKRNKRKGRV